MNVKWLAGTALMGGALVVSPAMAEVSTPVGKMQLKLGGYVEFQAGFFSNNLKNSTGREFVQKSQITVDGQVTADNGLSYGPHVEIREIPDTSASGTGSGSASPLRFTQTWLHIAGNFGRFEIGDRRGPGFLSAVSEPTIGFGGLNSDYDSIMHNGPAVSSGGVDFSYVRPANANRSTKIVYYTPVFAGFQAGVSYAPEINKGDSTVVQNATVAPNARYTDIVEGTVTYKNTFSDVGILASFNINHLTGYGKEVAGGQSARADATPIYGGLNISYAGFTLGGGAGTQGGFTPQINSVSGPFNANVGTYKDATWGGGALVRLRTFYNVGATYQTGPYGVGVNFGSIDTNRDASNSAINFGLGYTVTPGLILGADYFHTWYDAILVNNSRSTTDRGDYFILSSRINF